MKIYLKTILLTLFLTAGSCDNNPADSSGNANTLTSINGILHGYNPEENVLEARLSSSSGSLVIGIDTIGSDSILNLSLPTPPDSVLLPMQEVANGYGGPLTVSDPNAKGTDFLRLNFYHREFGIISGSLMRSRLISNPYYYVGGYEVRLAYCDRRVNISGSIVLIFSIIGPPDTIIYNVNINLTKGWNTITYRTVSIKENYFQYEVINEDPPDAKWFYRDIQPGDFLPARKD
ncbi:MAG: hypothetical protein WAT71_07940 [Ignavibacteria bacterium]